MRLGRLRIGLTSAASSLPPPLRSRAGVRGGANGSHFFAAGFCWICMARPPSLTLPHKGAGIVTLGLLAAAFLFLLNAVVLLASPAFAARIKDIATLRGAGDSQLVGY